MIARCLYEWYWDFVNFIIPPTCVGCGKLGVQWCATCDLNGQIDLSLMCYHCGTPEASGKCRCREYSTAYDAVCSLGRYEDPLRKAVVHLKYHNQDRGLGLALGRNLWQNLQTLQWNFDIVTPIPLGDKRMQERGYNQATLIAYPIARLSLAEFFPKAVKRIKETRSQTQLSKEQRRENVKGAFIANDQLVEGCSILLVDDVFTTGSTLDACAQALKLAGASKVYGVTIARALEHTDSVWNAIN